MAIENVEGFYDSNIKDLKTRIKEEQVKKIYFKDGIKDKDHLELISELHIERDELMKKVNTMPRWGVINFFMGLVFGVIVSILSMLGSM